MITVMTAKYKVIIFEMKTHSNLTDVEFELKIKLFYK